MLRPCLGSPIDGLGFGDDGTIWAVSFCWPIIGATGELGPLSPWPWWGASRRSANPGATLMRI
jgi:hypothetical protein